MPPATPRSPSEYSSRHHGVDTSGYPGDYTVTPGIGRVRTFSPREADPNYFWMRPWPAHEPAEPTVTLVPGRVPSTDGPGLEWGGWNRRVPIVKFAGLPEDEGGMKITYHPYSPLKPELARAHPYAKLCNSVTTAAKATKFSSGHRWNVDWNKYAVKDANRRDDHFAFKYTDACWYMQGAVYHDGKRDYMVERKGVPYGAGKDDDLPLVRISKGVGDMLLGQPQGLLWKPNPKGGFGYPDPVGVQHKKTAAAVGWVEGGLFFKFFFPKKQKWCLSKHSTFADQLAKNELRYYQGAECSVWREYEAANRIKSEPSIKGEHYDALMDRWQFWEADEKTGQPGLLRYASFEQQAVWLAQAYKPLAEMVEFAWEGTEFLTEDVLKILHGARSVTKPADARPLTAAAKAAPQPTSAVPEGETYESEEFDDFPDAGSSGPTTAVTDDFDAAPDASFLDAPADGGSDAEVEDLFLDDDVAPAPSAAAAPTDDAGDAFFNDDADGDGDGGEIEAEADDLLSDAPEPAPAIVKPKPPAGRGGTPPTPAPTPRAARPNPAPQKPAPKPAGKPGVSSKKK